MCRSLCCSRFQGAKRNKRTLHSTQERARAKKHRRKPREGKNRRAGVVREKQTQRSSRHGERKKEGGRAKEKKAEEGLCLFMFPFCVESWATIAHSVQPRCQSRSHSSAPFRLVEPLLRPLLLFSSRPHPPSSCCSAAPSCVLHQARRPPRPTPLLPCSCRFPACASRAFSRCSVPRAFVRSFAPCFDFFFSSCACLRVRMCMRVCACVHACGCFRAA